MLEVEAGLASYAAGHSDQCVLAIHTQDLDAAAEAVQEAVAEMRSKPSYWEVTVDAGRLTVVFDYKDFRRSAAVLVQHIQRRLKARHVEGKLTRHELEALPYIYDGAADTVGTWAPAGDFDVRGLPLGFPTDLDPPLASQYVMAKRSRDGGILATWRRDAGNTFSDWIDQLRDLGFELDGPLEGPFEDDHLYCFKLGQRLYTFARHDGHGDAWCFESDRMLRRGRHHFSYLQVTWRARSDVEMRE